MEILSNIWLTDVVQTIEQNKICSLLNSSLNAFRPTTPLMKNIESFWVNEYDNFVI